MSMPGKSTPGTNRTARSVVLIALFAVLGICAVLGIIQVRRFTCSDEPGSLRNPPIPAGAEQITVATPTAEPYEGFVVKEMHFETASKPEEVYNFYKQSLDNDGWTTDYEVASIGYTILRGGLQKQPSTASATFYWKCRTALSPRGIAAVLWLHAQVLSPEKSRVILSYQYLR